jgi:ApaG protein
LISNSNTNTTTVTSYYDTLVKISVTTSPVPGLPVSIQTAASHFPFAYRVKIENVGKKTFQILSRQWTFIDSNGKTIEVPKGSPRIVGHAPILKPGQIFEYVSGVELRTARGTMKGSLRVSVIDEKEEEKEEEFEHKKVEERENNKKGIILEKRSTLATQFDALVAETVLVQ